MECQSFLFWPALLLSLPYNDLEGVYASYKGQYVAIFTVQKTVIKKINNNRRGGDCSNFHCFHSNFFADFLFFPTDFSVHYPWFSKAGNVSNHQSLLPPLFLTFSQFFC